MSDDFDSRTRTDVRGVVGASVRGPPLVVSVFDERVTYRPIAVRTRMRLGREGAEVVLADSKVSRVHAELALQNGALFLTDLGSRNGTWKNGERVGSEAVPLEPGDVVRMGRSLFVCVSWPTPAVPDFDYRSGPLVGGPLFDPVRRAVDIAAHDDKSVLVLGETGTGKELVAAEVHRKSGRAGKLVAVNCATLPETLVESELFGHARGAFSGSHEARRGLVRQADGGTLFLDEIGELPASAQAVLLRVLEEQKVRPVGADTESAVDVRVIAATHRDLDSMVQSGAFRADLLHRLAVHVVRLPPLRARPEDVVALAHVLLPAGFSLSADVLEVLLCTTFEGNVRGLRNALDHAVASARARGATELELADVSVEKTRFDSHRATPATSGRRAELEAALEKANGNMAKAARALGIHRSTLYAELLRQGLDAASFRKR